MNCTGNKLKKMLGLATFLIGGSTLCFAGYAEAKPKLSPKEQLGKFLYLDENLSEPSGQSCSSCHHPDFAFVDPDSDIPVSEGVIPGLFGGRNSPSAAYAMYAPPLYFDTNEGLWIGGQFWDGRATGEVLGDPLADQALGPFLNPVEMANTVKAEVIADVAASDYAELFEEVWGAGSLSDIDSAYDKVALSIAAFERTELFAPFSSKYDAYLQECIDQGGNKDDCAQGVGRISWKAGRKIFNFIEWRGLKLFMGENNNDGIREWNEGAMCAACHIADWTPAADNVIVPDWSPDGTVPPMFTDFTFDNLGAPKNIEYPLDPNAPADLGLGNTVSDANENGKFKVMSLRNISRTAPYAHNGFFKTLDEITHFYNTRDLAGADWPEPEYPDTMNTSELGSLGLSYFDEKALVEFMKTLSDGYRIRNRR